MVDKQTNKDLEAGNTKMFSTGWKNSPTLRELKENLQAAKSTHAAAESNITKWLDNLNVKNAPKNNGNNRSSIVPKLIRKQAEWRYPALSEPFLSTDDLFNVNPVTEEDKDAAYQNELLLSNQFTVKMDRTAFIDEYVRTAVDEGTVILRTGWDYEEEEYEEETPVLEFVQNEAYLPVIEELMALRENSPSEYLNVEDELKQAVEVSEATGFPMEPNIIDYEMVKKIRVLKNQPTVTVCNYKNVIIDPSCEGDIDKASFVIHSYESSLSDLRKAGIYKNLDNIQVENNSPNADPYHDSKVANAAFSFADKPRKKLVIYEYWGYWDIENSGMTKPIVITWVGDTIIRMEENPYPDKKLPFVTVQYLPVRKSIYGEPDGALLEDNQRIAGALTRGFIDTIARASAGQQGIRKDMLDNLNRKRFESGQDYFFNPNIDPRLGVYTHTFPELSQSALVLLEHQNVEAESLTGVKAYNQGISSNSLGDVAASVRGALDAASKRELGILRRLSNGLIKVARKFIAMNSVFLEDEEVIRITNKQFVTVRKDDLGGNFDLKLSISTAEEDATKLERLSFLLQTMGNTLPPEMTKVVLADIMRLQKMPDLAHQILSYEPEPDPVQQELAQLEVEKIKSEIAKTNAITAELNSQAALNQAKAMVEQVRAGHIQSDKDLKDLNYVEQESGVTQARALQLHGEQARSQAENKLMDNEYKLATKQLELEAKKAERSNKSNKD